MLSRFALIFAIAFVPFLIAQDDNSQDPTCMLMLENFANFSARYTYCTIVNSRPIAICQECVLHYINVTLIYSDIANIDSMIGKKCETEIANLDRLQVFENGYKYIKDMWSRAYCDSCFVLDDKQRPTNQLTEFVKEILNASLGHKACIDFYHNETSSKPDLVTCNACSDTYQLLNSLYSNFKIDSGRIDFCMDVVDLINNTRIQWSDQLGCLKDRRGPELTFIFAATGISALPVLFYGVIYAFTSKKEHPLIERRPKISTLSPPTANGLCEPSDSQAISRIASE